MRRHLRHAWKKKEKSQRAVASSFGRNKAWRQSCSPEWQMTAGLDCHHTGKTKEGKKKRARRVRPQFDAAARWRPSADSVATAQVSDQSRGGVRASFGKHGSARNGGTGSKKVSCAPAVASRYNSDRRTAERVPAMSDPATRKQEKTPPGSNQEPCSASQRAKACFAVQFTSQVPWGRQSRSTTKNGGKKKRAPLSRPLNGESEVPRLPLPVERGAR